MTVRSSVAAGSVATAWFGTEGGFVACTPAPPAAIAAALVKVEAPAASSSQSITSSSVVVVAVVGAAFGFSVFVELAGGDCCCWEAS